MLFTIVRKWTLSMLALLLLGCTAVGPTHVQTDRLDYGTALARSLQEQAVLNIVKSRYTDWPSFLDISQIVAGYERSGTASLSLDWLPNNSSSNAVENGLSGTYSESPTFTFTPLTGDDFSKTLLSPLDTETILAIAYSGWQADRLFDLTLNSIQGLDNDQFIGDALRPADADFLEVLALFRDLQRANAWGLRRTSASTSKGNDQDPATSSQGGDGSDDSDRLELVFRPSSEGSEIRRQADRLKNLLGLSADQDRFRVVFSDSAVEEGEISFESRTLWETLWELQRFVQVPEADLAAGRILRLPTVDHDHTPALTIRSSREQPERAFVAVPYGGHWFWIADNDITSRHTLSALLLMSTLARTSDSNPPRLVIPTR